MCCMHVRQAFAREGAESHIPTRKHVPTCTFQHATQILDF